MRSPRQGRSLPKARRTDARRTTCPRVHRFMYALAHGYGMMTQPVPARPCVEETASKVVNWHDRSTCVLRRRRGAVVLDRTWAAGSWFEWGRRCGAFTSTCLRRFAHPALPRPCAGAPLLEMTGPECSSSPSRAVSFARSDERWGSDRGHRRATCRTRRRRIIETLQEARNRGGRFVVNVDGTGTTSGASALARRRPTDGRLTDGSRCLRGGRRTDVGSALLNGLRREGAVSKSGLLPAMIWSMGWPRDREAVPDAMEVYRSEARPRPTT